MVPPAPAGAQDVDAVARWVGRIPLPIGAKLLVALGTLVLLLVVLGALALSVLAAADVRAQRVYELERRSAAYRDLREEIGDQLTAVASAIGTGDPDEIETAARQLTLGSYRLDRVQFVAGEEAVLVADVRSAYDDYARATARVVDLVRAGSTDAARSLYASQVRPLADRLDRRTNLLVLRAEQEMLESIDRSADQYQASQRLVLAIALGSVAIALVLGIVLSLAILRPVHDMGEEVRRIGIGDFSRHVAAVNRDELGTLARSINGMNDELAHLYAEVRDASRRKSEFLANMSHELRTPLNAVIGFAEVLQQKLFGDLNPRQEEYAGDIATSGKHLLSLVNDILDLSKVEAGKMELQRSVFSLGDAVESGAMMVRERAARRGIALTVQVDPDLAPIDADERKVKQVLFNLLSNAVKFTPEGGSIGVAAHRLDGELQVSVRDTGPGIALEDQGRIFEEFQQTATGARTEDSTGLGLTLAKKFIELHGGRLWVKSEVGEGSTFTFSLPALKQP